MHTNQMWHPNIWITFLIKSFPLILLNAISPYGLSIFFCFLDEIQVSVISDFKDLKLCWYANVAKSLIGPLSRPFAPCGPWKPSVSNVIVNGEDLSEVTLCNMLNFIYFNMDLNLCSGQVNMQLCGFHCIPGYSISVSTSNFIHFNCLHVVYRDFLWLRFTKCAQTWIILFKSACTSTVRYRMVYFVSFQSFWPFNSKLGSIYSFQLSGGLAPWQCCYL